MLLFRYFFKWAGWEAFPLLLHYFRCSKIEVLHLVVHKYFILVIRFLFPELRLFARVLLFLFQFFICIRIVIEFSLREENGKLPGFYQLHLIDLKLLVFFQIKLRNHFQVVSIIQLCYFGEPFILQVEYIVFEASKTVIRFSEG